MGIGLCVVAPDSETDAIIRTFKRRGFPASKVGSVKRGSGVTVGPLRVDN
jgi:phosphoribosylaminoimidazole (AIR) synthetase